MAKKDREEVELAFNLELDTRKATRGLAAIERTIRKTVARKVDISLDKKSMSEFKKGIRGYQKELGAIQKVIREVGGGKNLQKATANLNKLQEVHTRFEKTLKAETLRMERSKQRIKEKMAKADNELVRRTLEKQLKDEQAAFRKRIAMAKRDVARERRVLSKNISGAGGALIFEKHAEIAEKRRRSAEAREQGIADLKAHEVGKDLGESFADTVQSLSGKDLLGMAKGGAKLSSAILKGIGKYGMHAGRDLQIKGMGRGGASGAALAGIGKALSGLGPLVQSLAKLGPALGLAASSFGALFKLILDVEAAAKDMNRQILEGASAAETFASVGYRANTGYQKLSSTLDQIRADATSLENVPWGLKAEDIIRVTNTLAQQGVTLDSLKKGFANAGSAADESARQIKGFGDLARMSFAYSRIMGVSLQEITDFQAEMFTELGQSLSSINLGYARLTRDATESGIATNKFFSIIRGVSSDLGLYTTRLEQASSMLKLLGKVMNPREAQKFMSVATQGFKQMGEEDRLRMTLLAGEGRMRDIITKDLERKTKLLYNDIAKGAGVAFEDVVAAAKAGGGELDKILSKVADNQRGALQSALTEIRLDEQAMRSGSMGTAEAAANLSAAGALEATKAALQRLGGNKKLREMSGIEAYAARKAANVSLDQFRAMVKLEESVDKQREEMVAALKDPSINPELVSRLNALGINLENIYKKGDADIIAAMGRSDQEALVEAVEQKDYAKQTAELTTTITDKMDIVVDGIFNYLYVALKDVVSAIHSVIDWLTSKFGGSTNLGSALASRKNAQNAAYLTRLQSVVGSERDPNKAKELVISAVEKSVARLFESAASSGMKLDPSSDLEKLIPRDFKSRGMLKSMLGSGSAATNKFFEILSAQGGRGIGKALEQSGMNQEEIKRLYGKALWLQMKEESGDVAETLAGLQIAALSAQYLPAGAGGAPSIEQARARAAEGMQGGTGQSAAASKAETVGASAPLITHGNRMVASPITGTTVGMPSEGTVMAEQLDMTGRENVQNLQNLYDALRRRGIVLDETQLRGPVKDTIREGTLDAFREALFEHAVYSSSNPATVLQRMKDSGFTGVSGMAARYEQLQANAVGGTVVGVANGRAVIAAPGEGLASVGRGERIVPAGGGGGTNITLNVNGIGGADLANYLRKKIAEGVYEYKRREKFQ